MHSVIFLFLLEETLHPLTLVFMVSLVTHCDVPWKPFPPSLSPSSEGRVWPRCVSVLPPPAFWLHHRLELDGGRAGKIISRQRRRESEATGAQRSYFSVYVTCMWICALSEAIRANALSLSMLYSISSSSLISRSAAAAVSSRAGEPLHCWTVSLTLSYLRQELTDCILSRV